MYTLWTIHNGGEAPKEIEGFRFEAKYRNGQTAKYGRGAKARWVFHTNSVTPFDIVAYRPLA